MYASKVALLVAATASLASAGNVYVDNRCTNSVFLWSFANEDEPVSKGEIRPGASYTETQRPATEPAGNNTILITTDMRLTDPLEFSYSVNNDAGVVFYSFVSVETPFDDYLGYEVLTNGGHDPVTCPPPVPSGGDGYICPNTRDGNNGSTSPVFTVPINSQPNGPDFTVRVCEFDGRN
ncbi:MAG: hypothetical protein Q9162_007296 [Coniocarpon cinnabarinum]